MSLAVLRSRALAGMEAPAVNVEVHLANGLPGIAIVGLPDTEVREAKDRVRAALQNSGFFWPMLKTVNLLGALSLLLNIVPAFGLALLAPVIAVIGPPSRAAMRVVASARGSLATCM